MPTAQYVASFKLNVVDRPESLKKWEDEIGHFARFLKHSQ
jgi:hypothetical protein